MGVRRLLMLSAVVALAAMATSVASASVTLDFEDADGVSWNGNLYGEPIFGPGEDPSYYHGFYFEGWRVYDKDGVAGVYGTSSYLYVGTNGDRSVGRTSFDPKYISRDEDFYFEGATFGASDTLLDDYPLVVEMIGYLDGGQVWHETVSISNGTTEAIDFTSSYSDVLVDSVRFHAWEYYMAGFVLDDFIYSEPDGGDETPTVPVPGAVWLVGSGLCCLLGVRRNKK